MNKTRRKELENIISDMRDKLCELESLRDEEQECYDNLPEGIQESERGDAMCECADALDESCTDFENVIDQLDEILSTY